MSTTPLTVVNSDNLKAFQSGIGSGFDLMIEKQLEKDYTEDFNVIASIHGFYEQETKEYLHQPFQYRVKATGEQIIKVSDGFATIHAEATPVHEISVTVQKMISIPVTIRIRIKFKVEYFIRTETGIETRTKTLYTEPVLFKTGYNQITVNDSGTISLTPYNGEKVSSTPISQYINQAIQRDAELVESMKYYPITQHGYEIQDDYPFDIDNPYRQQAQRQFQSSSFGTFTVTANYVNGKLDLNSTLRAYGVANAGLFCGRKVINRDISIHDGAKTTLLSFTDFKAIPLVNVDDPNYRLTDVTYDSSDPKSVSYHLSQIENPQQFKLYANRYQSITRDDFLVIEPTGASESNQASYRFDHQESYLDVAYHKLIPTIKKDPLQRYHYKLTILDCSSNIVIDNVPVKPKQVIRTTGTGVRHFTIISQFKDQAIAWTSVLPNPNGETPFSGSVNGGNYLIDYGKRDHQTYIPTFSIPTNVRNVRFEILLEGMTEEAPLNVRFEEESEPGVGIKNGGQVIFSSEKFAYQTREFSHVVSQNVLKGFEISGLAEQVYSANLYKDSEANFSYSHFEMELKTDNNDVKITDYPKLVQFQNGECSFRFKARIQQNAVSKWSPRIHSGFYYLNQHEYYMPSSFDAQANYDAGTYFAVEDFKVSLKAEFVKSEATHALRIPLSGEHDYRNNADRFRYFKYERSGNNHWVYAIPTIQTGHYECYSDLEYISPIKTLHHIIEVWDQITWDEQVTETESLSFEARVYDLVRGKWTAWTPIVSGQRPRLVPSNLIQFKAKLSFNQTVEPVQTIVEHKQTATDYRAIMDVKNSRNITFVDGEVRPLNSTMPATFCTTIIDYGTAVNLMATYSSKAGNVTCFLGASQDRASLERLERLPRYTPGTKISQKRYYRMKFEIDHNDSLYQLKTAIEIAPLKKASIRFGNIQVNGVKREHAKHHVAFEDYAVSLKMDGLPHELLPNIESVLSQCVEETEFNLDNLYYYQFTATHPQVELTYSSTNPQGPLVGTSVMGRIDTSHAPMIRFINGRTVIKATPEQFSPIVVEHELYGPLREVFFLKEGRPSLEFEECYPLSSTFIPLKHHPIDKRTLRVFDAQTHQSLTHWRIEENKLFIDQEDIQEVKVQYRLQNSFIAFINESKGETTIQIHTDKPLDSSEIIDKAFVSFETNLNSNKRVLSHLSLNPLYNTHYEGFIYLSNTLEPVKTLKVTANPTVFKPKQPDHSTIYIQALDRYENPVPGETIQVSESVGVLEAIQDVTDQNGVAIFRYHSPKGAGQEELTFQTKSGVQEHLMVQVKKPTHRRI